MIEKVWYEMLHTKFGEIYLAHYITWQKNTRKWFNIITLLFSTGGVLGWPIWEYIPLIACTIVATIQVVNLLENQIIPSDQEIEKTSELRDEYISYFNNLEKLWSMIKHEELFEKDVTNKFYQLREIGAKIESLDNKLNIKQNKKTIVKADSETRNYFSQYHS